MMMGRGIYLGKNFEKYIFSLFSKKYFSVLCPSSPSYCIANYSFLVMR